MLPLFFVLVPCPRLEKARSQKQIRTSAVHPGVPESEAFCWMCQCRLGRKLKHPVLPILNGLQTYRFLCRPSLQTSNKPGLQKAVKLQIKKQERNRNSFSQNHSS